MAEPQSMKQQNWSDFPRYSYSIFSDDFVHHHLLNLKFRSDAPRSSSDIRISAKKKESTVDIGHEVKLLWKLGKGRAMCGKFKSNSYFKFHFDNGIIQRGGIKCNLYGSINGYKALQKINLRLGVHLIGQEFQSDSRIKLQWGASALNTKCTFYNRSAFNFGEFRLGLLGAYELYGAHPNLLVKNNCIVGYQPDDKTSVFLRLQNAGYRKDYIQLPDLKALFDYCYLDVISSFKDSIRYGFELAYSFKENKFDDILAVFEYQNRKWEHTYKIKVSHKLHTSLLWKFKTPLLGDHSFHSLGFHSKLLHKKTPIAFGFQTEFNI